MSESPRISFDEWIERFGEDVRATLPQSTVERISVGMDREQIADMIAASEARNETGLERAMGEVRAEFAKINGKLESLPGRWELLAFTVGTAIALFAAILAALSYGNDRFGVGAEASKTIDEAITRAVAAQAAKSPPADPTIPVAKP